jgi:hypothetical protein
VIAEQDGKWWMRAGIAVAIVVTLIALGVAFGWG